MKSQCQQCPALAPRVTTKGESKDFKQNQQETNQSDFTNPQGSQNLPNFSGYATEHPENPKHGIKKIYTWRI